MALTATVVVGLLGLPAGAGAQSAVADRIDPAHSGGIDLAGLVPPLRQRWAVDLEPPDVYDPRISYPLVAGGRIFVVVVPSATAVPVLHALSAASGATLWSRTLAGTSAGAPAYDGGTGVRGHQPRRARVRRGDRGAGLGPRRRWPPPATRRSRPTASSTRTTAGERWRCAPRTDRRSWGRDLFAATHVTLGAQHAFYQGGQHTYALRRSDGGVAWEFFPGAGTHTGASLAAPALHQGRLWFTDSVDATLLDAATGALAGSRDSTRPPAFWGGTAFVMWGSNPVDPPARVLQARDAATDVLRWEFAGERGMLGGPTVVTGVVYAIGANRSLYGLDAADGRIRWCTTLPRSGTQRSHIAAGEGVVVVVAGSAIVAFEPGGAAGCDYNRVSRPGWYGPPAAPVVTGAQRVTLRTAAPSVERVTLRRVGGGVRARVRGNRLNGRRLVVYAGRPARRAGAARLRRVAPRRFAARVRTARPGRLRACVRLAGDRCGRRTLPVRSRELWPR